MALKNAVELGTGSYDGSMPQAHAGRSSAGKTGDRGLVRLRSDLPPEIAIAIESFERTSFRLNYVIIVLAGAALALTLFLAYCVTLVAGK